ncbi:MAG: hypothetical protein AAF770_02110 [Bacteroidota bacterium]
MIKFADIEQEYLRSFIAEEEKNPQEQENLLNKKSSIEETIRKGALSIDDVVPISQRRQAAIGMSKILSQSKQLQKKLAQEKEAVLDQYSWQDLNLIAGNTTTPSKSILNRIKKTHTTIGGCVMATQIVNPTTNKKEIDSKQKVTQFLLDNTEVTNKIDESIQEVATSEALGLSLWEQDNHLTHKEYKKELNYFYYHRFGLQNKNTSAWLLQLKKWWKDIWLHPILGFSLLTCLLYTLFWGLTDPMYKLAAAIAKNRTNPAEYQFLITRVHHSFGEHLAWFFAWDLLLPFISLLRITERQNPSDPSLTQKTWGLEYYKTLLNSDTSIYLKITILSAWIIPILLGIYFCYKAYRKYVRNQSLINFLADHLLPFQTLIIQAQKISTIIAQNSPLEKHYGKHIRAIRSLLVTPKQSTNEEELFIHSLQTVDLHSRFYFFRHVGRLLATYQLFQKHKQVLADIYYEIGKIDAQLSICKLIQETNQPNSKNQFTFGKLQTSQDQLPNLQMKGMWPIALDPGKAVSNDVIMNSKKGPRTMVITGPNAGGKSTYILSICINAILNQVYGIVAAHSAVQAIFYKIITYVNPVQNLAAGLSLAEAGMQVLKTHQLILDQIKGPILAIVDEILNGTDPKIAAKYSYRILKNRNQQYSNCLTLLTTHFMNLTNLAKQDQHVKNQKVVVKIPGTNGRKFDYTYQIEEGITDQNIVEDMLIEKGIL